MTATGRSGQRSGQPAAPGDLGPALSQPRGRVILYHRDIANYCPSCGKQQWFVGRRSATCAFCEDSIPLACPLGEPDSGSNAI